MVLTIRRHTNIIPNKDNVETMKKLTYDTFNRMITKVAKQYSAAARLALWAAAICPTPVVELIASLIGKRAE